MPHLFNTPGTLTALNSPNGISTYDAPGSFYISDTLNRVVRRVYPNGTTRVVAGQLGVQGVTGNRVAGTAATLNFPRAITISGDAIIIADSGANAVRILFANQTIATLAGTLAVNGYSGDGGLGEYHG